MESCEGCWIVLKVGKKLVTGCGCRKLMECISL